MLPGVACSLPLELLLTIVNVNDNCTPITNALVYVWHCDKDGLYSGYRQPGASTVGQTFCQSAALPPTTCSPMASSISSAR
jgi:protocatechuate 3,4-dioxygenase beta subunit